MRVAGGYTGSENNVRFLAAMRRHRHRNRFRHDSNRHPKDRIPHNRSKLSLLAIVLPIAQVYFRQIQQILLRLIAWVLRQAS